MSNSHPLRTGLFALYASIVLLALNGLFAKVIPLDATSMTQARSVIATLVLFFVLALQKEAWRLPTLKSIFGVYGLGVLLGLHWITYFYSMQVSTVAIGMLSLFSYPVITVLIEPLFKGHAPKLIDIIAGFIVVSGVALMVLPQLLQGELNSGAIIGATWGVISAVIFSIRNTAQKYCFPHVNSKALMGHQTLAVALMLLPFLNLTAVVSMDAQQILLLLLLGCFSTALAHTFLSVALKHLPAKSVALISCAVPVVGGALAWLVMDEKPDMMVYIGGAVILSVAAFESMKQGRA